MHKLITNVFTQEHLAKAHPHLLEYLILKSHNTEALRYELFTQHSWIETPHFDYLVKLLDTHILLRHKFALKKYSV